MLPSQRALFDIPREVCYLNAAAFGPLPRTVQEAGERGAARKSRPWRSGTGRATPRRNPSAPAPLRRS